MAIAAERSHHMAGYLYEPVSDLTGIDNIDTDIEIIYRERTAVWCQSATTTPLIVVSK